MTLPPSLNTERTVTRRLESGEEQIEYLLHIAPEQWEAFNVASHYEQAQVGDARLNKFTVTASDARMDYLKAQWAPLRQQRWTPPGDYIRLQLHDIVEQDEWEAKATGGWVTVMSDTPDEANDHAEFINLAYGQVLIHGLGLGACLAAVLSKDDVDYVDVVEVNAEVIDLIAPYFQEYVDAGRLTIHHDSCATKVWPVNSFWDVVWHDIWSNIDHYNLTDDAKAEHGISYATMHRKFASRCNWQASWGWPQARRFRASELKFKRKCARWVAEYNDADQEDRYDMIVAATAGATPVEVWAVSIHHLHYDPDTTFSQHYRRVAKEDLDMADARRILRRDND